MSNPQPRQLELSPSLLFQICEAAPRGILIADKEGIVIYINKRLAEVLKLKPEEIVGKSLRTSKIFGAKRESDLILLVDESKPFKFITHLNHHDEEYIWEFNGYAFEGGFLIEGEDVTDEIHHRQMLELREQKYERQVEIAQRLQRDIFPTKSQKKRIDVQTHLITADDLAGDFFSITDLGPNSIGVIIGDVVGKGIAASLMAMSIHTFFMQQARLLRSPSDLLSLVNGMVHNRFKGDFWYATAFYARITMSNLMVTYARAGHEFPLWYRAETHTVEELSGDGLPLGMFSNPFYETRQIQLSEGDRLLFFTDGLPDALNHEGERFGRERLIEILKANGRKSGEEIHDELKKQLSDFIGDMPIADDIAFAVFSIVPDMWTTWEIPPRTFDELLDSVMEELIEHGVNEEDRSDIRLALDECYHNAHQHGNQRRPDLPVIVSYLIDSSTASFKIRDFGKGFDYENLPDPRLDEYAWNETGRGVFITRYVMDEVSFNEIGNEITIVKNFKKRSEN